MRHYKYTKIAVFKKALRSVMYDESALSELINCLDQQGLPISFAEALIRTEKHLKIKENSVVVSVNKMAGSDEMVNLEFNYRTTNDTFFDNAKKGSKKSLLSAVKAESKRIQWTELSLTRGCKMPDGNTFIEVMSRVRPDKNLRMYEYIVKIVNKKEMLDTITLRDSSEKRRYKLKP